MVIKGRYLGIPQKITSSGNHYNQRLGNWVGAPSTYQGNDGYCLTYRCRRPRGEGRGFEGRIAYSHDGVVFDDIWMVHQWDVETNSLERFALTRRGLEYILYISYGDPQDNR